MPAGAPAHGQEGRRAGSGAWARRPLLGLAVCGLLAGMSPGAAPSVGEPPALPAAAVLAAFRTPAVIPFPPEDPYDPAVARLGERLFFDPVLSASGQVSCASCHEPGRAWSDGGAHRVGTGPGELPVRVPTILDCAFIDAYGWDGKSDDLEGFTFVPLSSHVIMDLPEARALERLSAAPDYARQFAAAFPGQGISHATLGRALATFERTVVSRQAPFDRFVEGDAAALTPAQRRGFSVFSGRGGCAQCHAGWALTDGSFQDIGVGEEPGRGAYFPGSVALQHAFKVPTLRDVARRGPFMHDGSLPSLRAVVDFYDRGGTDRPSRSHLIRPLGLSEGEKADLLAFLGALTSDSANGGPALPAH